MRENRRSTDGFQPFQLSGGSDVVENDEAEDYQENHEHGDEDGEDSAGDDDGSDDGDEAPEKVRDFLRQGFVGNVQVGGEPVKNIWQDLRLYLLPQPARSLIGTVLPVGNSACGCSIKKRHGSPENRVQHFVMKELGSLGASEIQHCLSEVRNDCFANSKRRIKSQIEFWIDIFIDIPIGPSRKPKSTGSVQALAHGKKNEEDGGRLQSDHLHVIQVHGPPHFAFQSCNSGYVHVVI